MTNIKINNLKKKFPELSEQWHFTKNGDLHPSQVTPFNNEKVWWKCPVADDHEWEARICNRTIRGDGCPCCYRRKVVPSNCLATTHCELIKEWHPVKNGQLTPFDVVSGSNRKVWWKCPVADDHEWIDTVQHKINRNYCPFCINRKVCKGNCLVTTHSFLLKEWDFNKNISKPEEFTAGSNKKVWWKCPVADDHEWIARIVDRAEGSNCPCCSGNKLVFSNSLLGKFPELAKQWHPVKNGQLTPIDVHSGSDNRAWWKCPVADDHEWFGIISNRTKRQRGCPCCSGHKVSQDNCLETLSPNVAKQWHPTKNGKLTPRNLTSNSNRKVWWKCPVADDHEWKSSVNNRAGFLARNCPYCANQKVCKSNCLATTHPNTAKEWHFTKNGELLPSQIVAGSNKKYWWICKKGHSWRAMCSARTSKRDQTGCPICNESKGERLIREYLLKEKIKYKQQFRFKEITKYPYDFLVVKNKKIAIIEYQGIQHYTPQSFDKKLFKTNQIKMNLLEKIIIRDYKKKQFCIKKNIPLLEIPFWEKDNINKILDDWFSNKEIVFGEPPEVVKKHEAKKKKIIERIIKK